MLNFLKRSNLLTISSTVILLSILGCAVSGTQTSSKADVSTSDQISDQRPLAKDIKSKKSESFRAPIIYSDFVNSDHPLSNADQTRWIYQFSDPALIALVQKAMENNLDLSASAEQIKQAAEEIYITGEAFYPSLDFRTSIRRGLQETNRAGGKQGSDDVIRNRSPYDVPSTTSKNQIAHDGGFELELWQALDHQEQRVNLNYATEKAEFSGQALLLVSNVTSAWYQLNHQKQLLELYQRREHTLRNALQVVEQNLTGDQQNIQKLKQSRINLIKINEKIDEQQQKIADQIRNLQHLIGYYPEGMELFTGDLIDIALPALPDLSLPSELISRQPDLQKKWLNLLSVNPDLAATNRARFPKFMLTMNVENNINWDLISEHTQPLFRESESHSIDLEAQSSAQRLEKRYLKTLFSSFAAVENVLMQETTLTHRLQESSQVLIEKRQLTEKTLHDYQVGQTSLDQLLMAQKNMLDVEANVIDFQYQQLQNRIQLSRLLGGSPFADTKIKSAL